MRVPLASPGRAVAELGRRSLTALADLGRLTLTAADAFLKLGRSALPGARFRARAAMDQMYLLGASALPIVGLIAVMMGAILAFQGAYTLERLGAEQYVADMVAVALTRELGPVITAVVMAGRSGSAIAAEIASMKVQEELDALRVMGLNPTAFLVAPKLLAMLVAMPLLTALADLVGIIGGMACSVAVLDMSIDEYVSRTEEALVMRDFVTGLIKSVVFGGIIVSVGAFCGLAVQGGAEDVGRATTRSVVLAIFLVIVADLVFTGYFYTFG